MAQKRKLYIPLSCSKYCRARQDIRTVYNCQGRVRPPLPPTHQEQGGKRKEEKKMTKRKQITRDEPEDSMTFDQEVFGVTGLAGITDRGEWIKQTSGLKNMRNYW